MSETTNIPISQLPTGSEITGSELVPVWQVTLGNGITIQISVNALVLGGSDGVSLVANGNGQLSVGNVASGSVAINGTLETLSDILNGLSPFRIATGTNGDASALTVSPLGLTYTDTLAKFLGGQRAMILAGGTSGDITNTTVTVSGVVHTMAQIAAAALA